MTIAVSATTRMTTMVSSSCSNTVRKRLKATAKVPSGDRGGRPPGRAATAMTASGGLAEGKRLVDQLLAAGDVFGEFVIDRFAGGDERVLVGLVHLHAAILELLEKILIEIGRDLERCRLHLPGGFGEHLLHVGGQAPPA